MLRVEWQWNKQGNQIEGDKVVERWEIKRVTMTVKK